MGLASLWGAGGRLGWRSGSRGFVGAGGEGFALEADVAIYLGSEVGALRDGGIFAGTELRKSGVGRIGVCAESFVVTANGCGFIVGQANRSDNEGNFAVVAEMLFHFDFGDVAGGFGSLGDDDHAVEEDVVEHFEFDDIADVGGGGRERLENTHVDGSALQ